MDLASLKMHIKMIVSKVTKSSMGIIRICSFLYSFQFLFLYCL